MPEGVKATEFTVEGFAPGVVAGPGVSAFAPTVEAPSVLSVPGQYSSLPCVPAMLACVACTARQEASRVVPGAGPIDARMLWIGQNPGQEEDSLGVPFIGNAGKEVDVWFRVLGLDRAKMVVTNIVRCHTIGNRVPRAKEIKTCADLWLDRELAELKNVSVVFTLGKPAAIGLLGKSAPPMTPMIVHHFRIRAHGRELRAFPLPHPAYLLRAKHMAPMFYETILHQLKLTLLQEAPEAYAWSKGP